MAVSTENIGKKEKGDKGKKEKGKERILETAATVFQCLRLSRRC